jgi:hypothetical protein
MADVAVGGAKATGLGFLAEFGLGVLVRVSVLI